MPLPIPGAKTRFLVGNGAGAGALQVTFPGKVTDWETAGLHLCVFGGAEG